MKKENAKKTLFLIITLSFFSLLISCNAKTPVIESIDPKIGRMGEVITLTGVNFGEDRDGSYITIAGVAPTSSSYYIWQDDTIMVRVPELGDSGLVFVHVKGKKSNGVLFSNIASVPRPIVGEGLGSEPGIISVNPQFGPPGTVVTINGINFGASREIGVFFSWDFTPAAHNPFAVKEQEYVQVSDYDFGYISWSQRQIVVKVPDGAVSGNMEVRTSAGKSRPIFFDVTGRPGNKNFLDKRSYTVSYSVDIRALEATQPNSLNLWMPAPAEISSQRNIKLISHNAEPAAESNRSANVFKFDNLLTESYRSITVSYQVDVYAVETSIRAISINKQETPLSGIYTEPTNLIPANNWQVVSTVETIISDEQNPYIKARKIYDWLAANISITDANQAASGNVNAALSQKRADAYTMAILFSAMMRAADVPCAPVAGVLIDSNRQTIRHYWTEFWIDGFGWIPADPALGAGQYKPNNGIFSVMEDYKNYYFGNIDNRRIAFSFDQPNNPRLNRNSRVVSPSQSYSLQNIWEEASGGLESYSSFWGDIVITGIYSQ